MSRSTKFRTLVGTAVVATSALLTLGFAATSALASPAGVTPTPCPTPSIQHFSGVSPTPDQGLPTCTPTPCPTSTGIQHFSSVNPNDGNCPTPEPCPTATQPQVFAPTVSPTNCPTPPPVVNPLRPERFVTQYALAVIGGVPTVLLNRTVASGPVSGTGSSVQVSNTLNRFNLPGVFRQVNVLHTGIINPNINLTACTASVEQLGRWAFAGGTGPFVRATGSGLFVEDLQAVFPQIRGVCSLSLIAGNPLLQNRIQPTYVSFEVAGAGNARV
jgi:hypothetical protein